MTGSSLSSVQTLIDGLIERDPSGRTWLPALLAATPRGRAALGELVDEPGGLEIALAVRGVNGRRTTFDYVVPPPRELLAWFIDNPDELEWPAAAELTAEVTTLRRALLNDDPPGSRTRAQDRARERLASAPPLLADWWRFEEVTRPDAVLATERMVVVIEEGGQREQPTAWYPERTRLIRVAEAAMQLAHGRRWATIVITDPGSAVGAGESFAAGDEGLAADDEGLAAGDESLAAGDESLAAGDESFAAGLRRGAPHLTASERDELAASYLGGLTLDEATAAVAE